MSYWYLLLGPALSNSLPCSYLSACLLTVRRLRGRSEQGDLKAVQRMRDMLDSADRMGIPVREHANIKLEPL